MNLKNNRDERPLSPHLTIHSKFLTSLFSISHRITGIGLSLGTVFISLWIGLIAFGENYFFIFEYISSTILFKIILFFWSLAVSYHLFNGTRYLFWSFGVGMEINTVYSSGYLVLFLSLIFTLMIWII
jgi:succinate dehydrogenase, cytochrome b556 subunit